MNIGVTQYPHTSNHICRKFYEKFKLLSMTRSGSWNLRRRGRRRREGREGRRRRGQNGERQKRKGREGGGKRGHRKSERRKTKRSKIKRRRRREDDGEERRRRRRRRREDGEEKCRSCSLLLVADHSFFTEVSHHLPSLHILSTTFTCKLRYNCTSLSYTTLHHPLDGVHIYSREGR